jgi:hypothetical protein
MKKKTKVVKANLPSKKPVSEEVQGEKKITKEQIESLLNENYYLSELSKMKDESQFRLQIVIALQKMLMLLEKLPTLIEVMQKTPKALEEISKAVKESYSEEEESDNPLNSEETEEEEDEESS